MAGQNKYRVIITQEADADINRIVDWYESQTEGLGKRWIDHFYEVEKQLADNPLLYQEDILFVRKVVMRPFKYNVFYVPDETDFTVLILGVLHQHQSKDEILSRLNFS